MTTAVTTKPRKTVIDIMRANSPKVQAMLPAHMRDDIRRVVRMVEAETSRTPQLLTADPGSFMRAVGTASAMGMVVGYHAHLIPFNNKKKGITEVQLIINYRGLGELAHRSGRIESVEGHVVYEGDDYELQLGSDRKVRHNPAPPKLGEQRIPVAAYAIAHMKGGGWQFEWMWRSDIEKVRARGRTNEVWETDWEPMAVKTVMRRLYKYIPSSPDIMRALELENLHDTGDSQDSILMTMDGDGVFEVEPPPDTKEDVKAALRKRPSDVPEHTPAD